MKLEEYFADITPYTGTIRDYGSAMYLLRGASFKSVHLMKVLIVGEYCHEATSTEMKFQKIPSQGSLCYEVLPENVGGSTLEFEAPTLMNDSCAVHYTGEG